MKTNELHACGIEDISEEEMQKINGGESFWYWVAYGAGSVGRGVSFVWNECARDPEYYMFAAMSA